jgi:hypothetical protein
VARWAAVAGSAGAGLSSFVTGVPPNREFHWFNIDPVPDH